MVTCKKHSPKGKELIGDVITTKKRGNQTVIGMYSSNLFDYSIVVTAQPVTISSLKQKLSTPLQVHSLSKHKHVSHLNYTPTWSWLITMTLQHLLLDSGKQSNPRKSSVSMAEKWLHLLQLFLLSVKSKFQAY